MTRKSEDISDLQSSFGRVYISASAPVNLFSTAAADDGTGKEMAENKRSRKQSKTKVKRCGWRSALHKKHDDSPQSLCEDQDGDALMMCGDSDLGCLLPVDQKLRKVQAKSRGERYQPYCRRRRKNQHLSGTTAAQHVNFNLIRGCQHYAKYATETTQNPDRNVHFGSTCVPHEAELYKIVTARMNTCHRSVDLSGLYRDQTLCEAGIFLPISRQPITAYIGTVIAVKMPEAEILNVSCNRLSSLKSVQEILKRVPSIKCLNLEKNCLRDMESLKTIKGHHLTELVLRGNSICGRYKSWEDYLSAVRKMFPHLIKLDGQELSQTSTSDTHRSILPPPLASCLSHTPLQERVLFFLQEFFTVFDSPSRQPLINAYHKDALFSLTVAANPLAEHRHTQFDAAYLCRNKNLKGFPAHHSRNKGKRKSQLRTGQQTIVSEQEALPRTSHYPSSFLVDITKVSDSMLCVVVSGVFSDQTKKVDTSPMYAFSRSFIMAVSDAGDLVVTNDVLTITNASLAQQGQTAKSASSHEGATSLLSSITGQILAASTESARSKLANLEVTRPPPQCSIAD